MAPADTISTVFRETLKDSREPPLSAEAVKARSAALYWLYSQAT